jgi:phage shock protein B
MHDLTALVGILASFIGLPWLIFHYAAQWKKNAALTREDEGLLDELHALAGRFSERLSTVERIIAADHPDWRSIAGDPGPARELVPIEAEQSNH